MIECEQLYHFHCIKVKTFGHSNKSKRNILSAPSLWCGHPGAASWASQGEFPPDLISPGNLLAPGSITRRCPDTDPAHNIPSRSSKAGVRGINTMNIRYSDLHTYLCRYITCNRVEQLDFHHWIQQISRPIQRLRFIYTVSYFVINDLVEAETLKLWIFPIQILPSRRLSHYVGKKSKSGIFLIKHV